METETHTLTRDGAPDVRFRGAKLAAVSSFNHRNNNTRWTEINIYQTSLRGQYLVQVVGRTQWVNESNRFAVHVCKDENAVIEALTVDGYLSDLAKEALDDAGIECVEIVK